MRRARFVPFVAAVILLVGATGCTHNHYYYGASPLCETTPAVVEYGAVCEVPSTNRAVIVADAPPSRRVAVSRPRNKAGSGFAWRSPDPEALATTRVEGGLDDATLR